MNNQKFAPHSSSHQQRIIYLFLEGRLNLDTTLDILESTCSRITENTISKLQDISEGNGKAKALLYALETAKLKSCINGRPMDVLNLIVKHDLHLKAVAEELCISIDSVNKHVAALKNRFDCQTIARAVYLAMKEGLITEEEAPEDERQAKENYS